ncbi:VanW family protein, partial [Escherichia coli]
EVRQGCIVPALGGGICQLSNALYDLALKANFEIVERHPHTRTVPNSDVPSGRDATVAWNHIDLRFRSQVAYRIEAHLTSGELIVRFRLAEKP